ncbi:uncharacterized protein PHALS_03870 [Plasmopara halstedii]|uniref:Uncharacterized protein n=1 Tax=Plasmopara halstedii TaxID=4781 RepID=A0A0P1AY50_PLAHL|nr:uncharacterized protein PHALS_03870 [Plasmopara halstedii]CEG47222.1 hypothetical protein PHALS_03870 [Plasmopara halstedii]|eukprot:XP_024583591.1 hypothetical protein PHALS_03870 [Plasmopara halstedii]
MCAAYTKEGKEHNMWFSSQTRLSLTLRLQELYLVATSSAHVFGGLSSILTNI